MKLKKVNELVRYQEIVDRYKRKGCLTNDYLYKDAADLIIHNKLFEYCGANNAFLYVYKDKCLRIYYFLNDLKEFYDFDLDEDIAIEILFRGNMGVPDVEIEYLTKCGFRIHLRRDQYTALYRDLAQPAHIPGTIVRKAKTQGEVTMASELFNSIFDVYTGDYISEMVQLAIAAEGNMWIATDADGHFAGALHQTIEHGVAWISHIAVLPTYRGRGVGQALLDAFVEGNHQNDKSRYMLWVQAQNEAAVKMYLKKGFKYIGKSTISMLKKK